ncbi:FimV/HubP family polar landmark protein [Brumicola pallidula]|uniref:Pilus assembly protein FimV n=1 Tax=Brumicola pallidula DSM 14239 = ACAM 615 TaxID=1121922 RepID=K6ZYL5_9ALTE|nr:FimV/HubP family polar landmark protein [Glaciecola pallidula]GAC28385.1 pilus assembly protein FimV [Glaciecola pallidula DSM 14239 = ACAM 615]
MKWSLLLIRAMLVAVLCFTVASNAVAQGTQIQGPRDAADVYSGVVYGPIDRSDTLWAISSQYRKNQQFTVYQVMLAIYELNPRGFVNRNFNTMVNGTTLQLPTDRYIARIDPQRARVKAQQDDLAFTQSTGRQGQNSDNTSGAQPEPTNLKPDVPLVNKKELDAAEKQFQQQINSLKRQQASIVSDFKQQLDQSIQTTQSIIDENKLVLAELAKKDEEFIALKTELSEDFQAKLDDQAAQIQELREFVALAKRQDKAEQDDSFGALIRKPIFIIIATTVAFFLVFVLVALLLLRKPKNENVDTAENDAEKISLDDPVSKDADDLLAILDSDDISDDDLLDDILSDELEESIDEVALDSNDFGEIDDEMLVPNQKAKKSQDDLSDALADLDSEDISLDDEMLNSEFEGIDLDDDDIDLDGDDSSIDEAAAFDGLDDEPNEVDIDSILAEQSVDISQVEADASKQLREGDDLSDDGTSFAENLAEADLLPIQDDDDDEQSEIDIDDLLEQSALEGEVPNGLSLGRSGEIDEKVIEQIEAEIAEKNIELNTLTENFDEELANNDFVDDGSDIDDDDLELNISGAAVSSDTQKAIRPLDELTKGLEDDIADAIANQEDEDLVEVLGNQDLDDPLSDELLTDLGAELSDDDIDAEIEHLLTQPLADEIDDVDIDPASVLEDSLNELQTGTIDFEQHEELTDDLDDALLDENSLLSSDSTNLKLTDDENEDPEDIDIDSVLDDSLNDLINNQLEDSDLDLDADDSFKLDELKSEQEAQSHHHLDSESALEDLITKVEGTEDKHQELDDFSPDMLTELDSYDVPDEIELDEIELDNLSDIDIPNLDIPDLSLIESDESDESDESESENGLDLDDIPSFANAETSFESEKGIASAGSDDGLLDLPGLDDWLEDGDGDGDGDDELAQALDKFNEADSEDDVLREIEDSDFDSLLAEMGNLSDEQTAAEIDKLVDEDPNEAPIDPGTDKLKAETLDNPDLDLTALFDSSAVEDSKDFIDVDSLLQESEHLTPATDDELALDLDMSLDKFLNDEPEIDVDLDADQSSNLDLARVYIDMEDNEAAKEALEEVLQKGNDEQKEEAQALLQHLRD